MPELGDRPKGFVRCPECGKMTLTISSKQWRGNLHYYVECVNCGFKQEIGYRSFSRGSFKGVFRMRKPIEEMSREELEEYLAPKRSKYIPGMYFKRDIFKLIGLILKDYYTELEESTDEEEDDW